MIENCSNFSPRRWLGAFILLTTVLSGLALRGAAPGKDVVDPLERGFAAPPLSARPNVWWFWLNGRISEAGITRDLEELKDKGFSGATIYDLLAHGRFDWMAPEVEFDGLPPEAEFMGERWRALFRHAVREANRLGLEIGLNLSSGWNCGGKWITPENGFQRIVWSEREVVGPSVFEEALPRPDRPPQAPLVGCESREPVPESARREVAVVAVPLPDGPREPANSPKPAITQWKEKCNHQEADYDYTPDLMRESTAHPETAPGASPGAVVDLTPHLDGQGRLKWQVPPGRWLILRFAHVPTGLLKQFSSPLGQGLMLDHLSAQAEDIHFRASAEKLIAELEPVLRKTFTHLSCDSCDLRSFNWTPNFPTEFRRRRGYDLRPYLPILAGRIVGNLEVSGRFLYDFRRTMADCIAEYHYGRFRELANRWGMQVRAEAGGPPPVPIDALQCYGQTDVPMGEFWSQAGTMFVRGAASAAHVYGKRLVAAESFTCTSSHWHQGPLELKPYVDRAFCEGLNLCTFHGLGQSPSGTGKPGYVYFAGTHFGPNLTWWDQMRAFTDYLARCQFLLQQGWFVGDACYWYGDQVPNFVPPDRNKPFPLAPPSLGTGYSCDFANTEAILKRMSVRDGRIVLPDGMSYRLLVCSPDIPGFTLHPESIPIELLRKLGELVEHGATVVWPKPSKATGLRNYPDSDTAVRQLADQLWGPCDGKTVTEHAVGQGRVVWGQTPRTVLHDLGVAPDFEAVGASAGLDFIHRRTDEADIYFVSNPASQWIEAQCAFRVAGRQPELWHPDTGRIEPQLTYDSSDGRTRLPLRLPPNGSCFVVFRAPAAGPHLVSVVREGVSGEWPSPEVLAVNDKGVRLRLWQPEACTVQDARGRTKVVAARDVAAPLGLSGPWEVSFPDGWGAPPTVELERLASWTESPVPGVKYFSGTAVYRRQLDLPARFVGPDVEVVLDLGNVANVAEVSLNGTALGTLWKPPFRVALRGAARAGPNLLEIRVTNLWPNRLIGDQFLPRERRFTRTNIEPYKKDSPLLPSGLLGPVRILFAEARDFSW